MSENNIYENLLGLAHLKVDAVAIGERKIEISCHISVQSGSCVCCAKSTTKIHQYTHRRLQDLTIVGKEVYLDIRVPQFHCDDCNRYFSYDLPFADSHKSYTHRQARWIFELCHQQPFTEVGALVNKSHQTVEDIYFAEAEKRIDVAERFKQVRKLGIDEISNKKGKGDYCCVLTDLERGIQLDILPDRKKATIIAYFKQLGDAFCDQIEVVSCDIWEPYILAARECFKNATISLDHFHIIKALNESLDATRKSLRKAYPKVEEYKKIKWLLFKKPQNCTEDERTTLQNAFQKSITLEQVYIHRNRFHDIYKTSQNASEMAQRLDEWTTIASKLESPVLDKFVKTVRNWKENIASFADTYVTNAVTEGLNNLIRHIKRISFGMPNFEHLRLRLLVRST
jgi:transposase